jgi:hypothetical protein
MTYCDLSILSIPSISFQSLSKIIYILVVQSNELWQPFESVTNKQYFKLEVSFEHQSLVAPLSWKVDGIVGGMNTLSDPPFHMDHGNAIY